MKTKQRRKARALRLLRFLNDIYAWVLSGERVPNLGGRGKLTPIDGGKNEGK